MNYKRNKKFGINRTTLKENLQNFTNMIYKLMILVHSKISFIFKSAPEIFQFLILLTFESILRAFISQIDITISNRNI